MATIHNNEAIENEFINAMIKCYKIIDDIEDNERRCNECDELFRENYDPKKMSPLDQIFIAVDNVVMSESSRNLWKRNRQHKRHSRGNTILIKAYAVLFPALLISLLLSFAVSRIPLTAGEASDSGAVFGISFVIFFVIAALLIYFCVISKSFAQKWFEPKHSSSDPYIPNWVGKAHKDLYLELSTRQREIQSEIDRLAADEWQPLYTEAKNLRMQMTLSNSNLFKDADVKDAYDGLGKANEYIKTITLEGKQAEEIKQSRIAILKVVGGAVGVAAVVATGVGAISNLSNRSAARHWIDNN